MLFCHLGEESVHFLKSVTPGRLLRTLNLRSSDGVDTQYTGGCDEEQQLKDQHSGVLLEFLVVNSTW